MKELQKDIKEGKIGRVYLLYGEEKYFLRYYERALVAAVGEKPDVFEENINVSQIIMAAETFSLLGGRRVIVARETGLFEGGRKEESEEMWEYLADVSPNALLIFVEKSADKRLKLFKRVCEVGRAVEMSRPSEKDIVHWLVETAKNDGKVLSMENANFLMNFSGEELDNLRNELLKLASFDEKRKEITKDDICRVCVKSVEANIFELVGAIGEKQGEKTLEVFTDMLALKEAPLMILSMIARQFRLLFLCKHLYEQGLRVDAIAAKTGQKVWSIRNILPQMSNFDEKSLLKNLEKCLEMDFAVKTGAMGERMAVETLIAGAVGV